MLATDPVRAVARSGPRLCRHRHAGPCGLLRHRRLYRGLAGRARLGRADQRPLVAAMRRRYRRFVSGARRAAHAGPDAADADADRRHHALRGRQQGGHGHRRRRRTAGHGRVAGAGLPLRPVRQDRLFYCLAVLFVGWLIARAIVHSPFGRSLTGIRENERAHACHRLAGVPARACHVYTISAALAGVAGALVAQTTAVCRRWTC